MSVLRPAVADGGTLTARGRVVHAGRSLALSEATISDAAGRDLTRCTSRCFLFPAREVPVELPSLPPVRPAMLADAALVTAALTTAPAGTAFVPPSAGSRLMVLARVPARALGRLV